MIDGDFELNYGLLTAQYNLACPITQIRRRLQCRQAGARLLQDLSAGVDVGAFESDDEWDLEAGGAVFVFVGFGGVDDALCDDGAVHDAAEDVDEDALDSVVGEDDFEGFGDGLFGG